MAKKGGKVDYKEIIALRDKLEKNLTGKGLDLFLDSCAKELAARLLAKVIKRTPVGQYPKESGKKGGTLRRGWTNGKSSSSFAQELKIHHFGDACVIEIINPVEYASYVEFGHRTRGGQGWVEGKFMLTLSEEEIQRDAPKILESKLKKMLGGIFK